MILKALALGAAILGSTVMLSSPALADWHGGGDRGGDWHGGHEGGWHGDHDGGWRGDRDGGWRGDDDAWQGDGYWDNWRHWHWYAGYGPAYGYEGPPPVYYAPPPPEYYAPPPPVYYAPPPAIFIGPGGIGIAP